MRPQFWGATQVREKGNLESPLYYEGIKLGFVTSSLLLGRQGIQIYRVFTPQKRPPRPEWKSKKKEFRVKVKKSEEIS